MQFVILTMNLIFNVSYYWLIHMFCKAFARDSFANIKLSKTQMSTGLPLMKNILKPLA